MTGPKNPVLGEALKENIETWFANRGTKATATTLRAKTGIGQGVAASILGGKGTSIKVVEKIAGKLEVSALALLSRGQIPAEMTKDEAAEVEAFRERIKNLTPAQLTALWGSEEMARLMAGASFDSDKMGPEWDASKRGKGKP